MGSRGAHRYDTIYHAPNTGHEYLLLKFGKCYHCVIIVIDNILQEICTLGVRFKDFFWRQKMTFCVKQKHVTIMLSFFYNNP